MTLNIAQHQKACLVQVNKDISSDFFVFFLLISRSWGKYYGQYNNSIGQALMVVTRASGPWWSAVLMKISFCNLKTKIEKN